MSIQVQGVLKEKPRYEILDGLRGVAALIVVAFHIFEGYATSPLDQLFNHGYLAVDFFFLLSGFVIGYAYDDRWGKITIKDFLKRRLIRLQPMVIFGSVLGLIFYYYGIGAKFPLIGATPLWQVCLLFVMGCLMFPAPISMDARGWTETYPLNGPTWSLMWEYLANLLYALVVRRFNTWMLSLLVVCSAFFTIDLTFNLNLFGFLTEVRHAPYTVIGGWNLSPEQLYIGFTRLFYPFFGGLLLSRLHATFRVRGGFWWCSFLVSVLLIMPRIGGANAMWQNGLYEALSILLLFPAIVVMGAGSKVTDTRTRAVCKFFGDISYPLYITHYPIVYMQMAWGAAHPELPLGVHILSSISTYLLCIGVAYGALKLYDEPVRAWLQKRYLKYK